MHRKSFASLVLFFALLTLAACTSLMTACSSSSSNASSGDDGGGDDGAAGDDAGGDTGPHPYPAFPVSGPQLVNRGGAVMANPNVVPVFYPGDSSQQKIESFLADTSVRPAIDDAVAEYGVSPMTLGKSIVQKSAAPSSVTDDDIRNLLTGDAATYPGGADTIYLFFMPSPQTTFTRSGITLCQQVGGYHDSIKRSDGTPIIYAVIPRCTKFAYFFDFDAVTTTTVHELAEAFTDPMSGFKTPAWLVVDTDHAAVGLVAAGLNNIANQENGDLCTPTSSLDVAKLGTISLPLLWSNKASAAGHDPCTGPGTRGPYFNVQPVLNNTSPVQVPEYGVVGLPTTITAPNVLAHVGQSVDVKLQAFSDAPTSGPWTIQALDDTNPQNPLLVVKLDKDKVSNGDIVTATVNVPSKAPSGTYLVAVVSKLGTELKFTGFLVRVL